MKEVLYPVNLNGKLLKLSERKEKYILGVILTFLFNTLNYHLAYNVKWFSSFFFKTYFNDLLMGLCAWTLAFFLINKLNNYINSNKPYFIRYILMYVLASVPAVLVLVIWTKMTSLVINEQNVNSEFYTHTLLIIALEAAFFCHIYLNYKTKSTTTQTSKPLTSSKIEMYHRQNKFYIDSAEISYFFTEFNLTKAFHIGGKKYNLNKNLKQLEETLNSAHFFRANRQYIVNRDAIKCISKAENKKLSIRINHDNDVIDVSISRTKSPHFKKWLNKKVHFNTKNGTVHLKNN